MEHSNIPLLLQKLLDNTLQTHELQELRQLAAEAGNDALFEDFIEAAFRKNAYPAPAGATVSELYQALMAKIEGSPAAIPASSTRIRSLRFRRIAVAAALFAGVAYLLYFWLSAPSSVAPAKPSLSAQTGQPRPGSDGAILTLADGSRLTLDSLGNGTLTTENGMQVVLENQQLTYRPAAEAAAPAEITYNTLTTPRGRQFRMVLPDGSKVWLNSASSLVYPTRFAGPERKVTITGEAYFEVVRNDRQPFRVVAYNHTTEVLGTSFNINAYADEPYTHTTLIEGRIRVLPEDMPGEKTVLQQPGQQARLTEAGPRQLQLTNADTEEVIAWKNGYFQFNEIDIRTLMRQVARWYDVEVQYEGKLDNLHFSGIVSRRQEIAQLLKILEASHQIRFRQEGQNLIVMPKD